MDNCRPRHQRRSRWCGTLGDLIPARIVLYFLSWSGFLVSFMMRNDINFAIIVMVKTTTNITEPTVATTVVPTATNGFENGAYLLQNATLLNETIWHSAENYTKQINETLMISKDDGEFDWSPFIKSLILGSFYWCYVISQVVGGVATQYFGTKNVFGWSQFATAVCSLCIPVAASTHYSLLITLRSIQGFASGLTWPAMYAIVGCWIPSSERSRFMSSFQGFSIGIGLTYPLCGYIIDNWSWREVFYTTGSIGIAWCIIWYFFAFNTPAEHPRITISEIEYIESNVSDEIKDGYGMKVPWRAIFTSLPAWSIGVTTFGRIWVHYTFIMGGPQYMKNILGFSIQENGLLSGLPFLCSYLASVVFCYIADKLITTKYMSLKNVRKLFTAISQIIPGLLVMMVGFLQGQLVIVLVMWFVAVTLITASYAGAMANIVDIAPNLAGPVLAFAQTIHMSASFLSPLVNGLLITDEKNINQWITVFILTAIVTVLTYIMYQIYGTGDIQPWNYPQRELESSKNSDSIIKMNMNGEHHDNIDDKLEIDQLSEEKAQRQQFINKNLK